MYAWLYESPIAASRVGKPSAGVGVDGGVADGVAWTLGVPGWDWGGEPESEVLTDGPALGVADV